MWEGNIFILIFCSRLVTLTEKLKGFCCSKPFQYYLLVFHLELCRFSNCKKPQIVGFSLFAFNFVAKRSIFAWAHLSSNSLLKTADNMLTINILIWSYKSGRCLVTSSHIFLSQLPLQNMSSHLSNFLHQFLLSTEWWHMLWESVKTVFQLQYQFLEWK